MTAVWRATASMATCVVATLWLACAPGRPGPARLDTMNDACETCRMTVSDARFAAQLVAPGEEPRFFDDIGCLAAYLAAHPSGPAGAAAYVSDHRTRAWVPAAEAVYLRVDRVQTPMDSHLIAHADAASRRADPASAGGVEASLAVVYPTGLPGTRGGRAE